MSAPNSPQADAEAEESTCPSSSSPDVSTPESPLNSLPNNFREALAEFRNNWQREIKSQNVDGSGNNNINLTTGGENFQNTTVFEESSLKEGEESSDVLSPLAGNLNPTAEEAQELAETFFRKAVDLEQRGKVYDALPLYKKAVQIVPDIEFKFYEHQKSKAAAAAAIDATEMPVNLKPSGDNVDPSSEDNDEELLGDLYEKFQLHFAREPYCKLLQSNRDPSVISTDVHISELPPEILMYILQWVVSSQLDMRSLEQCAAVCRGLYLCARDDRLWRLACIRVWGVNVGTLSESVEPGENECVNDDYPKMPIYHSWRQMFIERERVLFNGCYISKTTYLRMGENSFQDQYYRPVQLVEYYRYFRFLPDGTVLMMTTADEPAQGVTKLRNLQQLRPEVLRGHYRLYGSTVTIMLVKQQYIPSHKPHLRSRRGSSGIPPDEYQNQITKYCIEFDIKSRQKQKFVQLTWVHYSIIQTRNKIENTTEFDLAPSKYPPLRFSAVRSYHLDADAPLV